MRYLLGFLLLLSFEIGLSQEINNPDNRYFTITDSLTNRKFYLNAEQMPRFLDSSMTFNKFFLDNFKCPPSECIQTRIVISYIVEETGEITNKRILNKLNCDFSEEIMRVLDKLPKMKTGTINGKPVPVLVTYSLHIEVK